MKKIFYSLLGSMVVGIVSVGAAEIQEREQILAWVNNISAKQATLQEAMVKGKERVTLCQHCHGIDGNSKKPDIPNLAEQNPTYLVDQFQHFQTGVRKNFVMQTLASEFSFEDKVNLSIYFSHQKLKPVQADQAKASTGQRIFQSVCQACHGADGRGEMGYARLAGQQPLYVINTLKRFRDNARGNIAYGGSERRNVLMEQVANNLSDNDIEALANYIALLK